MAALAKAKDWAGLEKLSMQKVGHTMPLNELCKCFDGYALTVSGAQTAFHRPGGGIRRGMHRGKNSGDLHMLCGLYGRRVPRTDTVTSLCAQENEPGQAMKFLPKVRESLG